MASAAQDESKFFEELIGQIRKDRPSKRDLMTMKKSLCKQYGRKTMPTDIEILSHVQPDVVEELRTLLLTKPVRTASGVTPIAVMTAPANCPHGRCTYCPGGKGSIFGDVPQSYTGHEPSTMRSKRAGWDPYVTVINRLEQYISAGHIPQKVEIIIQGGTFPGMDEAYQEEFTIGLFKALNDFSEEFYDEDGTIDIAKFREFFELPGSVHDDERGARIRERVLALKQRRTVSQEEALEENEKAVIRCVGLTIETKPDWGLLDHGNVMLEQGCTRVELGVQTLYDDVLHATHRGHGLQETYDSVQILRDLGFKLNFHMMLGLPGVDVEMDRKALLELFDDERLMPDMLKIYPCLVMRGTPLYNDWKAGKFKPMETATASKLIAEIMPHVAPWCRIMRVQRDIPTNITSAGVDRTNLRQYIDEDLEGNRSRDIRARESGLRMRELRLKKEDVNAPHLTTRHFKASGGDEWFLSFEDHQHDLLYGYAKLRFPSANRRDEFVDKTAVLRELHVLGDAVGIGEKGETHLHAQHKGMGRTLLQECEKICRQHGFNRILVISGVGVREYYRKFGYSNMGPYMGKDL